MLTKIVNLEGILSSSLGPDERIIDQKITRLTAPGDNYGSLMLSVALTIEKNSVQRRINAVAKLIPPNEIVQKVFNTQITYRNELKFYSIIMPTLQHFEQQNGVENVLDFAPKYLGGRLNLLNNSDVLDEDAVLLLENLKIQNYDTLERTVGFDLETSKIIVETLARFHATSLALKLKQPAIFKQKISPYLSQWEYLAELRPKFIGNTLKLIESVCPQHYERAKNVLDLNPYPPPREPFACITHNDCWVNNILIKQNGGDKSIKIVDYQVIDYGSPVNDLIFFIFLSVQTPICRQYCDELLQQYYQIFVGTLKRFDCYTEEFSYENFNKELNYEARNSQFFHLMIMLPPIFRKKDNVPEVENLSEDHFSLEEPSIGQLEKLKFVVEEFAQRNWI